MFTPAASVKGARRAGVIQIGQLHKPCIAEWRGSDRMKDWSRRGAMPMPSRNRGRRATPEQLVRMYRATVLFLRWFAGSKSALRNGDGELLGPAHIARELKLSERGLYKSVGRFIALLPVEDVASGRVRRWRDTFLPIWDEYRRTR